MTGPGALGTVAAAPTPQVHAMHSATDPQTSTAATTGAKAPAARPGAHGRDGDDAAMPGHAFADLLLAAPPSPPSPDAADAAPVEDDAATGPDAAVPGQLLALLDGYRRDAGAPAAQAAPGGAPAGPDPAQAVGLDAAGLPAAGTAPADAGAAPAPARAAPPFATPLVAALETAGTAHAPAIPAAAMATAPAEGETTVVESLAASAAGAAPDAPDALAASAPAAAPRVQQAAPALPPLALPAEPGDGFDDGFGARIAWMAGQRLGHAEIRLNPEHVGPIDVRLKLDGDQVRAEFASANAEVRQAIEASLPRLREMLGQQGLQLGHADVGQGRPDADGGAARAGGSGHAQAGGGGGGGDADGADPAPAAAPVRTRGLVDAYA